MLLSRVSWAKEIPSPVAESTVENFCEFLTCMMTVSEVARFVVNEVLRSTIFPYFLVHTLIALNALTASHVRNQLDESDFNSMFRESNLSNV